MQYLDAQQPGPGCPKLRTDLHYQRGNSPDIVIVFDPVSRQQYQLNNFEYQVALDLNGERDLPTLTALARKRVSWVGPDQIEQVIAHVASLGMLDHTRVRASSSAPMLSLINGGQSASTDTFDEAGLADDTVLVDDSLFDDNTVLTGTLDEPEPEPEPEPAQIWRPAPERAPLPQPPVPADPPPLPAAIPATPPATNTPQAWEVIQPQWYRRKRPRRLMYLGVISAALLAMAVIEYPLHITESCVMQPETQAMVRAPVDGILTEILVDEGELVTKGKPIARFDDKKLTYEMQRASAELDRLSANLAKMQSGSRPEEIKQARAVVAQKAQDAGFAQREVVRVAKLYRTGDASQIERDERQRDYTIKVAALNEAQAQLRLVQAGFRKEEVAIADADLRKAKADFQYYEKQIAMLTIKAPIDGKILTRRFRDRLNERIAAGDVIVEIGDATRMRVEILVPERDANVLLVGQPVTVKVHSLPLTPFHGKIMFLAPAIEEKDGERVIRADAVIENTDGLLQPRMSGYAEIDAGDMSVLNRVSRRVIRWVRVRFLI